MKMVNFTIELMDVMGSKSVMTGRVNFRAVTSVSKIAPLLLRPVMSAKILFDGVAVQTVSGKTWKNLVDEGQLENFLTLLLMEGKKAGMVSEAYSNGNEIYQATLTSDATASSMVYSSSGSHEDILEASGNFDFEWDEGNDINPYMVGGVTKILVREMLAEFIDQETPKYIAANLNVTLEAAIHAMKTMRQELLDESIESLALIIQQPSNQHILSR